MLLEISGKITSERKKGRRQSKNNTQFWMGLVIKERTTSARKRPGTGGAQLSEAPAVEAEGEENPEQGKIHRAGNQDSKK